MLRILFGAAALALCTPALACDGQTGKVIFEDKFTDDLGGWLFGAENNLLLKAPGATVTVPAAEGGNARVVFNQTFTAPQGDFCAEMSLPADAAQLEANIGVSFWGMDYTSYWLALVHADSKIGLHKRANNKWTTVWEAATNNLVKTGPTDVNSVRAVVTNGTIAVIVNGQTVKSVRALFPSGDLKFGLFAEYNKTSTTPVLYSVRSYKVTAVQ